MAAAFRAIADNSAASGTTATGNKPTGTADDDILIAVVQTTSSARTISAVPSGWTELEHPLPADFGIWVYWKLAASEPASWDWTWDATTVWRVTVMAYSGADPAAPNVSFSETSAADSVIEVGPMTTTVDDCLVISIVSEDSAAVSSWTADGSPVERIDSQVETALTTVVADETLATAGAITRTWTWGGSAQDIGGILIALAPAAGGGGGGGAPLDAVWLNFWSRGQMWDSFWQDAASGPVVPAGSIVASLAFDVVTLGRKIARGDVVTAQAFVPATTGRKIARGAVDTSFAQASATTGRKIARGAVVTEFAFAPVVTGRKKGKGSVAASQAFAIVTTGRKIGRGAIVTSWAFSPVVNSRPITGPPAGSTVTALAFTSASEGRKIGRGAVVTSQALASAVTSRKPPVPGTTLTSFAFTSATSGRKIARAAVATSWSFAPSTVGHKLGRGAIVTSQALTSAVASVIPPPADPRGTVGAHDQTRDTTGAIDAIRDTVVVAVGPSPSTGVHAEASGSVSTDSRTRDSVGASHG